MNPNYQEKFIGIIKWFHDDIKDANYGFILHTQLGDVFFHEKTLMKGEKVVDFKEGKVVTFNLNASNNKVKKIKVRSLQELPEVIKQDQAKKNPEAVQVVLLSNETDIEFLFRYYLVEIFEGSNLPLKRIIRSETERRLVELFEIISDENRISIVRYNYKTFFNEILNSNKVCEYEILTDLLNVAKKFPILSHDDIEKRIEEKTSEETWYKLWLNNYLLSCPVNYLARIIFTCDDFTRSRVFKRCTSKDRSNIFLKFIYNLEQVDRDFKLEKVTNFLNLTKQYANEEYDKILSATLSICPDFLKLSLWLEDFHENLDFDNYKVYTTTLPTSEQKRFVKKVLKYIHEGKSTITTAELTSINTMDYDTSKESQQIDNDKLDYSTSIILNVIAELKNQTSVEQKKEAKAAQNRMYDLIIKQIKNPSDILEISGFFDGCEGRCKIRKENITNENGEVIEVRIDKYRDENAKPKLHPICDGRKAMNLKTGDSALSEEGQEFWWCANQRCFEPSRRLHSSSEWENYSLLDFLYVLKVDFKITHYEIYLNLINKANRFLNHLKCRKCLNILRPQQKSNYAFYGVNLFHCCNEGCMENGKPIYITHCLNGLCEETIDSRDSVKCMPSGYEQEKCGWYVCNNCLSCCSSESLKRRDKIFKNTGQEHTCHHEGHRDLGIICCNKCGTPMESNIFDEVEYNRVLKWFSQNKDNPKYIIKSGKTQKGKWWFLFKKGEMNDKVYRKKLGTLRRLGFYIPDFDDKDKDVQLIAERKDAKYTESEILICTNKQCGITIDLSSDLERRSAIRRFHKVRFPRTERNFEA